MILDKCDNCRKEVPSYLIKNYHDKKLCLRCYEDAIYGF